MSATYPYPPLPATGPARRLLPRNLAGTGFAYLLLMGLLALSGDQRNEPAPYDLAMVGIAGLFFVLGLRFPRALALPAACLGLVLTGYMIGATQAVHLEDAQLSLRISMFLMGGFLFMASVVAAAPANAAPAMWNGYLIAGAYSGAIAVASFLGVMFTSEAFFGSGRAQALFQDPNVFGPFMVAPVLYAAMRMTTARAINVLVFWAPLTAIMVLGLFFSFSRGAWMHMLVSGTVFAILAYASPQQAGQRGRIAATAIIVVAAAILAIAWALTIPDIREMLSVRFAIQDYDTGQQGRFWGHWEAFKMALTHPFGIGQSNWPYVHNIDTHNVYLNVLVSGGFISFAGFAGLMGITLWKGFRYARRGPLRHYFIPAYAAFVGLLGEAYIIDIHHWRHFYVLLGIMWGLMAAAPLRRKERRAGT